MSPPQEGQHWTQRAATSKIARLTEAGAPGAAGAAPLVAGREQEPGHEHAIHQKPNMEGKIVRRMNRLG